MTKTSSPLAHCGIAPHPAGPAPLNTTWSPSWEASPSAAQEGAPPPLCHAEHPYISSDGDPFRCNRAKGHPDVHRFYGLSWAQDESASPPDAPGPNEAKGEASGVAGPSEATLAAAGWRDPRCGESDNLDGAGECVLPPGHEGNHREKDLGGHEWAQEDEDEADVAEARRRDGEPTVPLEQLMRGGEYSMLLPSTDERVPVCLDGYNGWVCQLDHGHKGAHRDAHWRKWLRYRTDENEPRVMTVDNDLSADLTIAAQLAKLRTLEQLEAGPKLPTDEWDADARAWVRGDDQPAPNGGVGDVWREVITDAFDWPECDGIITACVERRREGVKRYGQPLRRGDGRDERRDLLEECLDASVYAARLFGADHPSVRTFLAMAARVHAGGEP